LSGFIGQPCLDQKACQLKPQTLKEPAAFLCLDHVIIHYLKFEREKRENMLTVEIINTGQMNRVNPRHLAVTPKDEVW